MGNFSETFDNTEIDNLDRDQFMGLVENYGVLDETELKERMENISDFPGVVSGIVYELSNSYTNTLKSNNASANELYKQNKAVLDVLIKLVEDNEGEISFEQKMLAVKEMNGILERNEKIDAANKRWHEKMWDKKATIALTIATIIVGVFVGCKHYGKYVEKAA